MSVYSRITAVSSRKIVIVISYGNGAAAPCIGNTCRTICADIAVTFYNNLIYGTAGYFTYDIASRAVSIVLQIIVASVTLHTCNNVAVIYNGAIHNGTAVKFAGYAARCSIFSTPTRITLRGTESKNLSIGIERYGAVLNSAALVYNARYNADIQPALSAVVTFNRFGTAFHYHIEVIYRTGQFTKQATVRICGCIPIFCSSAAGIKPHTGISCCIRYIIRRAP